MTVANGMYLLNKYNLQRSTQLINKTNQFNLSTRRMSENELLNWSENSQRFWVVVVLLVFQVVHTTL